MMCNSVLRPWSQNYASADELAGLSKYSRGQVRQRGSSPKLQVLNTALMSAQDPRGVFAPLPRKAATKAAAA